MTTLTTLGLFALSLPAAGGLIWAMGKFGQSPRTAFGNAQPRDKSKNTPQDPARLVFSNDMLLDGSPAGFALAQARPEHGLTLETFSRKLSQDFPTLASAIETLPEEEKNCIKSADESRVMSLTQNGDHLVVEIVTPKADTPEASPLLGDARNAAVEHELESLRAAAHYLPCPVWRQSASGEIVWVNTAYLDLLAATHPDQFVQTWPPAKLFPDVSDAKQGTQSVRVSISSGEGTDQNWFAVNMEQIGEDRLFSAIPIDAAVRAEHSLADFTQTLTKTFAHLPTGLAIFDRERRLTLFNPALGELTTIRPEFLIRKPGLHAFLDKLRDKRMIPEPRDYRTWRHHIYTLEVEARNGTYNENWALPNGKTYRVTGQPHPNGAIAFMFDDISAEISMVRAHRTEIELFQSVIDEVAEAIVVFNSAGRHVLSNAKYKQEWAQDRNADDEPETVVDATKVWASKCAASPIWGDIRDFVGTMSERAEWTGHIHRDNGLSAQCRVSPLASGATLVAFGQTTREAARPTPRMTHHLMPLVDDVAKG